MDDHSFAALKPPVRRWSTGLFALSIPAAVFIATFYPIAAPVIALGALGWMFRFSLLTNLRWILAGICLAACIACFAIWPAATGIALLAGAIACLALRRPTAGFLVALLAFAAEGALKVLLTLDPPPISVSPEAYGAALLDFAVFSSAAAVVLSDRARTLRSIWARMSTLERTFVGLLAAWLVMSVLQIPQSGDPVQGAAGFRLTQAYAVAGALAGAVVLRPDRPRNVTALLLVLAVVCGYAALRAATGPTGPEYDFALGKETVTQYGDSFRTVGSFSSAVGLGSFLAPASVLAISLGLFWKGHRSLPTFVAASATVGIVASYGRMPLAAVVGGMLVAVALAFAGGGFTRRRKLILTAAVCGILGAGAIATVVAGQASPELRSRLAGITQPWNDPSVELRFNTWESVLNKVEHAPLGSGLGTVGGASGGAAIDETTTDNSFLKVLVEQGVIGGLIFTVGLFGACALLARRLIRTSGQPQVLGGAALAAFVSFLVLSQAGEYIEQPGKLLAWGLLGMATSYAFLAGVDRPRTDS